MTVEPPHRESANSALREVFIREGRLRPPWRLVGYGILLPLCIATMSMQLQLLALLQIVIGTHLPDWFHEAYLMGAYLGIVLLGTWLARRWFDRRPLRDLGLQSTPNWRREVAFGLALGGALMLGVFVIEAVLGWVRITGFAWQDYDVLTVVAFTFLEGWNITAAAVVEELIVRGYVLQTLEESVGLPAAVYISSVFFALLHATNPNASVLATINLVVAGGMFALAYVFTRRLWLPIALHAGWNFFQGTVFGFPVSGWQDFGLLHQVTAGPAPLTGGAFGPEGGVLGLLAMVGGILALRAWEQRGALRRAPVAPDPEPAAPAAERDPGSDRRDALVAAHESGMGSPETGDSR